MKATTLLCTAALIAPASAFAQDTSTDAAAGNSALALYNQGAAVVWQTRDVQLEAGKQTLSWQGVPPALLAESLWLAGDGIVLNSMTLTQRPNNSPSALLAQRIGQRVTLVSDDGDDKRQALLVSVDAGHAVVRMDGRLQWIGINNGWRVTWPAPNDKPEQAPLQLSVTAEHAGRQPLTLAYQRPGINWHASYTGRYDAQSGTLLLQSMAVISNDSSSPVQAQQVALIAGEVARTSGSQPRPLLMARSMADAATPKAQKTAAGHYRYQLDGAVNLAAGASQLLALLNARQFDVEREYYVGDYLPTDQRIHATVRLHLDNTADMPLPAGPVRIYGTTPALLLGEDRIDNTPVDAPITLTLGRAFDVTAQKRVTEAGQQDDNFRRSVEITLFNARAEATDVTVSQRLPRGAEIVSESNDHERESAASAAWVVNVPASGSITLTYTIHWTR